MDTSTAAAENPFDYFEYPQTDNGAGAHWAARPPRRPGDRFDLKLLPRSPTWRDEKRALAALAQVEREPWVAHARPVVDGVELRLDDAWIEAVGRGLQEGDREDRPLSDLARGQRFSVQFCDAGVDEALHVGHLRNLALGNALAGALTQAGADVERRCLIRDVDAGARDHAGLPGRRATLRRLAIAFDRVLFDSEFLADAAKLAVPTRALGAGSPTASLCDIAYWLAAPELDGATSVHVADAHAAAHATTRRELIPRLLDGDRDRVHPIHEIFHGAVTVGDLQSDSDPDSDEDRALAIDELVDWLQAEIETHPRGQSVLGERGSPETVAAHVALGYFLLYPARQRVDLFTEKLLRTRESPGWDLACARARDGHAHAPSGPSAQDPDYRFAVVQSELHRRQLRLAVQRLDPSPLARHVVQFARWHLQRERSEPVERVARTALDRGARGLGLE
jgi:hypothetical protein